MEVPKVPQVIAPPDCKRVVGYFISWGYYARDYHVKDFVYSGAAARVTHVNYAFSNVTSNDDGDIICAIGDPIPDLIGGYTAETSVDGVENIPSDAMRGNFDQLARAKEIHPHLRVLISLGGWTWSKHFSEAAATDEGRKTLVSSCVDLFITNLDYRGLFDGIDVDWEYPGSEGKPGNTVSPDDKANFVLLMKEFREQLTEASQESKDYYFLTAAVPATQEKLDAGYDVPGFEPYMDFINVMAYDFHGAWDSEGPTDFHANLYATPDSPSAAGNLSAESAMKVWADAGFSADKLVLGTPFYARGWTGVEAGPDGANGRWQAATGPAPGQFEAGFNDYHQLAPRESTFTSTFDPLSGTFYICNPDTGEWWNYDNPDVMKLKSQFVMKNGYGGVMFWEVSGDIRDGMPLLNGIHEGLGSTTADDTA